MVSDGILDTSILIDLLRGDEAAMGWFTGLGRQRMSITPIVWMETVQGAADKVKRAQAIRFLRQFRIEHSTEDDHRWAMRQLAHYHLSHGIGLEDTLIASVAVRLGVSLFTQNVKHYEPLPGLKVVRPY